MARPRTITPDPEEMIKLGEEMLAWVKKNKPLHLSAWYSIEKFIVSNVWETMKEAPEFLPYYEQAMRIIGMQYLDKTSNVRDSISQRWQRVYFKDLRKSEDQDLTEDAERKAKALKGDARATEEERQKVMEEVQRNRKPIT